MLVDDKLAKEKLARIPEKWIRSKTCDPSGSACTHQIMANEIVELIRNTDLTDCQQQPMEDCSVTQAQVPPSLSSSGTPLRPCPLCRGEAMGEEHPAHKHVFATFMPDYSGSYTIECPRCNLGLIADTEAEATAAWNSRVAAPDQGSVRNATDMRERCARVVRDRLEKVMNGERSGGEIAHLEDVLIAIRALPDQKD